MILMLRQRIVDCFFLTLIIGVFVFAVAAFCQPDFEHWRAANPNAPVWSYLLR